MYRGTGRKETKYYIAHSSIQFYTRGTLLYSDIPVGQCLS